MIIPNYCTKSQLYGWVAELRHGLGITASDYPLSSVAIAKKFCYNLIIETITFKGTDICGLLHKGRYYTSIGLNTNRSGLMQNFDCAHELIHYFDDTDITRYVCVDAVGDTVNQHDAKEWQANEGAAELLVPYALFLPLIKRHIHGVRMGDITFASVRKKLAVTFQVTEMVITTRCETLKYELHQYLRGESLDAIDILSATEQSKLDIGVDSINDIDYDIKREQREYESRMKDYELLDKLMDDMNPFP